MNKEQFKAEYRNDRLKRRFNNKLYSALKKQFQFDEEKRMKIYRKKFKLYNTRSCDVVITRYEFKERMIACNAKKGGIQISINISRANKK